MVNGQGTNVKGDTIRVRPPLQLPMFAPGGGPVPRNGGMGYGMHARRTTLAIEDRALHLGMNPSELFNADDTASRWSRKRWREQRDEEGDVIPKQHTGNVRSTKSIEGVPLLLLATYRVLFPKAQRCEIQAFLFRAHSGVGIDPFFYSATAITNAEADLGLNR
jgi:hypothetical protein